jgi:UDP-glucose 4-epimerase
MSRVVVTGASGFLGQAVVSNLASIGRSFTAVSRRLMPGYVHVNSYLDTPHSDILIHLAEEPDRGKVNMIGADYIDYSAAVIDALIKRTSTFIYASTGAVYGDSGDLPFGPGALTNPADVYARSKLRNEAIVLSTGGTVLRVSNLFGIGMSPRNVVSDIARQLPESGPIRVRDDTAVRDFLSVNAAANAISLLLSMPFSGVVNIGSGVGLSIHELVMLALNAVDQQGREIIVSHPSIRTSVNVLDIAETKSQLGWSPITSVEDTLDNFFRSGGNLDNQ